MRKFIGTLVILGVVVGGVGYYRGWFNVSRNEEEGTTNIEVTIDKNKIKEDAERVKEKAKDITNQDSSADG